MRVLFATCADKSILTTMVPLAWALRTAGHEVRVAGPPKFADVITQSGLTAVPVGRDAGRRKPSAADLVTDPDDIEIGLQPPSSISWPALQERYEYYVKWWHKSDNVPLIPGLVAFAKSWRPDLVIWEPTTFAGPVAAKAVGAAHARLLWGVDVFGLTRAHFLRLKPAGAEDPLAAWLGAYSEFTEDMASGHFTIDQLPPSLRMGVDELDYVPMRYIPYGGRSVVPQWLWNTPTRPRVLLTLGITSAESFDGYLVGVQDILDSLSDLDIEVVATVAATEQAKLRHIPDNARVVDFVPLQAIAPTCSAVIHHAGFGTVSTINLSAVPQVVLPTDFDEPALAQKLADQGVALTAHAKQATGALVRSYVEHVLHEPSFKQRGRELQNEMLAMPSPHDLVPQLEQLTLKHTRP